MHRGGHRGVYGTIHFKNIALGILPLDDENHTWLVGQYRFPIKTYSWEIPAGGGVLGDDPLVGAKRELKEETGIVAHKWEELGRSYLSNSVSDELSISYLARGLKAGKAHPDSNEELTVVRVPFSEAYRRVLSGEISDAMSVLTIMWANAKLGIV